MLIKELGNTIKERRKLLGITQQDLADLAGVNINTVIRIEGNKINPSIEVVSSIAEILGMELKLEVRKSTE
ncbi:MAG: helix-turn-helix domain-containing protein [Crocinitomicaceae bacterium]